MSIKFNDDYSFVVEKANEISYLYFPITNGYHLKSSITPNLNGDMKISQNHFALLPVSQEDLQNSLFNRHFWLNIENYGLYNLSGVSAKQKYEGKDEVEVEAGFLYHTIRRKNKNLPLSFTITTFSPFGKVNIELTKVTIKNHYDSDISFIPTVAIPLFSRSADNLRDHRHVTSLLNQVKVVQNGIVNKPKLSFDERGHVINDIIYGVFVSDEVKFYNPKLQEFIGEGGSLDWPKSLLKDNIGNYQVGDILEGYEVIGAMQLKEVTLKKNESKSYVFAILITDDENSLGNILDNFCTIEKFDELLLETKNKWQSILSGFSVTTNNETFDKWLKWVSLQSILRRIYGCSFLPHHDYGRGGRGWRDLWQDALALLLLDNQDIKSLLFNNFAGVRIDGSNATIIGDKPGEFIADRNNITRVWMDHGVWPWFTTRLYLERTGDIDFLFSKQVYFKDENIRLGKAKDKSWKEEYGNLQLTDTKEVYEGSILEHLLVQNLVQFFNVGEHNNILLANADWNDGLDMASDKGESVSFTAFYYQNLLEIKQLIIYLQEKGLRSIDVFKELHLLIDDNVDYRIPQSKNELLKQYFDALDTGFTGEKVSVNVDLLISSLDKKANFLKENIKNNEWIVLDENTGFFNGYYDNDGNRLEGVKNDQVYMTLTGQVFTLMSKIADEKKAKMIINAVNKYLYDKEVKSLRLNTNFNEVKLNMGRMFGFAFGHKENGAIFNHMVMMYIHALYKNNYINEAYRIIKNTFNHCMNFNKAKIYPGIPEYFDIEGRGMYHYLTGSSSWLIFNVVYEMYGVKGFYGDLLLEPKLPKEVFDGDFKTSITTVFNQRKLHITYYNKNNNDYYKINEVKINGKSINFITKNNGVLISKEYFNGKNIEIEIKFA